MEVYSGPVTHLPAVLCVLMKILSQASTKKKKKSLRVLNLNFNRSLLCDIMAVKGLKQTFKGGRCLNKRRTNKVDNNLSQFADVVDVFDSS